MIVLFTRSRACCKTAFGCEQLVVDILSVKYKLSSTFLIICFIWCSVNMIRECRAIVSMTSGTPEHYSSPPLEFPVHVLMPILFGELLWRAPFPKCSFFKSRIRR